jgi:hypothetical protein
LVHICKKGIYLNIAKDVFERSYEWDRQGKEAYTVI